MYYYLTYFEKKNNCLKIHIIVGKFICRVRVVRVGVQIAMNTVKEIFS